MYVLKIKFSTMLTLDTLTRIFFGSNQKLSTTAPTSSRVNSYQAGSFYSLPQFKTLSPAQRVHQLHQHGTDLGLEYRIKSIAFSLFSYCGFYVEVVEDRHTGEIRSVNCFKSKRKLRSFLQQANAFEI